MNNSKIIALAAIFLPYYLISAEPSAFGAGDLNNPNPYGLTPTESTLLETKKDLHKVVVKSNNQANEVDSLRERIDGLQTIIEAISSSTRENKLKLKLLEDEKNNNSEYDKRIAESIQINSREIEKIKLNIAEISKLIDSINTTYVTKEEFNSFINDLNKPKGSKVTEKQKKSQNSDMSDADIEKNAKELYDKKLYSESIEQYKQLIAKNYKPANAHYMVGEIEYYKKNYSDAIAYFKKSATLHSKASYMPTLMLHTAISMEKTGDKTNAEIFYDAIITQFPNSTHADSAKKNLKLMKK
ncbi:MAG: hypothetical protein A3K14_03295 [Sulfurimonas sp. RIFCSPLOWO2_12_FULL_36_74]|uniref:tetratricopeptide repeat protein n=1 Tax=unclassified Sulfurimonas TaxID=2623549 RepID=UPI0008C79CEF|nr:MULTISPECIES: tetratricopeptide repeat protein [unclassified Sulfurimonas]OHD98104.1 MAG: hypothetical protein A3J26_04285 [Sulfurimonas sp. RIFCSPLOWO2_02_FULL_36_28]OHE02245.1 MAG: hypothetical protein A2W82_01190 [Sulfurimonas sp. RIFCSPLOWO2_12_36_12]OHE03112.1 MAG: hypothetical protein A3K14_03295 [Sulfurimonas sp. RIFCSPLOWO2_12_FULL_36_74]